MSSPILSLRKITYRYDGNRQNALQEMNLDIHEGSVTAILGTNGAGKSTLLHVLLGWLAPKSGTIRLKGRLLKEYSRREAGQIMSLVPQMENMPFDYSILEYVLLGRTPYLNPLEAPRKGDLDIAMHAIDLAGLGGMASRAVTSLSGGERQLVLLARALTQQPEIVLLDEPTSHLDLANKSRLTAILRELNKAGSTIILTTHEPEAAAAVSTDVILMRAGQVVTSGSLDEIFTAENLTNTYGVPIRIVQVENQRIALWT
jgi:iron complex transport system ATP-binding protein